MSQTEKQVQVVNLPQISQLTNDDLYNLLCDIRNGDNKMDHLKWCFLSMEQYNSNDLKYKLLMRIISVQLRMSKELYDNNKELFQKYNDRIMGEDKIMKQISQYDSKFESSTLNQSINQYTKQQNKVYNSHSLYTRQCEVTLQMERDYDVQEQIDFQKQQQSTQETTQEIEQGKQAQQGIEKKRQKNINNSKLEKAEKGDDQNWYKSTYPIVHKLFDKVIIKQNDLLQYDIEDYLIKKLDKKNIWYCNYLERTCVVKMILHIYLKIITKQKQQVPNDLVGKIIEKLSILKEYIFENYDDQSLLNKIKQNQYIQSLEEKNEVENNILQYSNYQDIQEIKKKLLVDFSSTILQILEKKSSEINDQIFLKLKATVNSFVGYNEIIIKINKFIEYYNEQRNNNIDTVMHYYTQITLQQADLSLYSESLIHHLQQEQSIGKSFFHKVTLKELFLKILQNSQIKYEQQFFNLILKLIVISICSFNNQAETQIVIQLMNKMMELSNLQQNTSLFLTIICFNKDQYTNEEKKGLVQFVEKILEDGRNTALNILSLLAIKNLKLQMTKILLIENYLNRQVYFTFKNRYLEIGIEVDPIEKINYFSVILLTAEILEIQLKGQLIKLTPHCCNLLIKAIEENSDMQTKRKCSICIMLHSQNNRVYNLDSLVKLLSLKNNISIYLKLAFLNHFLQIDQKEAEINKEYLKYFSQIFFYKCFYVEYSEHTNSNYINKTIVERIKTFSKFSMNDDLLKIFYNVLKQEQQHSHYEKDVQQLIIMYTQSKQLDEYTLFIIQQRYMQNQESNIAQILENIIALGQVIEENVIAKYIQLAKKETKNLSKYLQNIKNIDLNQELKENDFQSYQTLKNVIGLESPVQLIKQKSIKQLQIQTQKGMEMPIFFFSIIQRFDFDQDTSIILKNIVTNRQQIQQLSIWMSQQYPQLNELNKELLLEIVTIDLNNNNTIDQQLWKILKDEMKQQNPSQSIVEFFCKNINQNEIRNDPEIEKSIWKSVKMNDDNNVIIIKSIIQTFNKYESNQEIEFYFFEILKLALYEVNETLLDSLQQFKFVEKQQNEITAILQELNKETYTKNILQLIDTILTEQSINDIKQKIQDEKEPNNHKKIYKSFSFNKRMDYIQNLFKLKKTQTALDFLNTETEFSDEIVEQLIMIEKQLKESQGVNEELKTLYEIFQKLILLTEPVKQVEELTKILIFSEMKQVHFEVTPKKFELIISLDKLKYKNLNEITDLIKLLEQMLSWIKQDQQNNDSKIPDRTMKRIQEIHDFYLKENQENESCAKCKKLSIEILSQAILQQQTFEQTINKKNADLLQTYIINNSSVEIELDIVQACTEYREPKQFKQLHQLMRKLCIHFEQNIAIRPNILSCLNHFIILQESKELRILYENIFQNKKNYDGNILLLCIKGLVLIKKQKYVQSEIFNQFCKSVEEKCKQIIGDQIEIQLSNNQLLFFAQIENIDDVLKKDENSKINIKKYLYKQLSFYVYNQLNYQEKNFEKFVVNYIINLQSIIQLDLFFIYILNFINEIQNEQQLIDLIYAFNMENKQKLYQLFETENMTLENFKIKWLKICLNISTNDADISNQIIIKNFSFEIFTIIINSLNKFWNHKEFINLFKFIINENIYKEDLISIKNIYTLEEYYFQLESRILIRWIEDQETQNHFKLIYLSSRKFNNLSFEEIKQILQQAKILNQSHNQKFMQHVVEVIITLLNQDKKILDLQQILYIINNNNIQQKGYWLKEVNQLIQEKRKMKDDFKDLKSLISLYKNKNSDQQCVNEITCNEIINSQATKYEIEELYNKNNLLDQEKFIKFIKHVYKQIKKKTLHEGQLLAIIQGMNKVHDNGIIMEVKTGEGKSFVITILAIYYCLQNRKKKTSIDIITSSSVLAKRDAEDQQIIYSEFKLKCNSNEDQGTYVEGVKPCYDKNIDIVYGDIGQFQFDYLRDKYYQLGTMGERKNCFLIIDEADNVLIDECTKIAKISQNFPGMSQLQLIYLQLWQLFSNIEDQIILGKDNKYYYIKDSEIIKSFTEAEQIFQFIEQNKQNSDVLELNDNVLNLIENILSNKIELFVKENDQILPKHLLQFFETQKSRWIKSLSNAHTLEENVEYIVKYGQIIPVDYENTGILMKNTNWSNGLHQFLQIKHNLKLTSENLTTNYISNYGFVKKYNKNIIGLTGTLGDEISREFLKNQYKVRLFVIPPHYNTQKIDYPDLYVNNETEWINAIIFQTDIEQKQQRGVLIICETISKGQLLHQQLSKYFKGIVTYLSNDEQQEAIKTIQSKMIIIATNIAGRGTDIDASQINNQGGLHIIQTFHALNDRVDAQQIGRTSRQGLKGTVQKIILGQNRNQQYNKELINQYTEQLKLIEKRDTAFDTFCCFFSEQKQKFKNMPLIHQQIEEEWAYLINQLDKNGEEDFMIKIQDFKNKYMNQSQVDFKFSNPYYLINKAFDLMYQQKDACKITFNDALRIDSTISAAYIGLGIAELQFIKKNDNEFKEKSIKQFQIAIKQFEKEKQLLIQFLSFQILKQPDQQKYTSYNLEQKQLYQTLSQQLQQKIEFLDQYISYLNINVFNFIKQTQRFVEIQGFKQNSQDQYIDQVYRKIDNELETKLPLKQLYIFNLQFMDLTYDQSGDQAIQTIQNLGKLKLDKFAIKLQNLTSEDFLKYFEPLKIFKNLNFQGILNVLQQYKTNWFTQLWKSTSCELIIYSKKEDNLDVIQIKNQILIQNIIQEIQIYSKQQNIMFDLTININNNNCIKSLQNKQFTLEVLQASNLNALFGLQSIQEKNISLTIDASLNKDKIQNLIELKFDNTLIEIEDSLPQFQQFKLSELKEKDESFLINIKSLSFINIDFKQAQSISKLFKYPQQIIKIDQLNYQDVQKYIYQNHIQCNLMFIDQTCKDSQLIIEQIQKANLKFTFSVQQINYETLIKAFDNASRKQRDLQVSLQTLDQIQNNNRFKFQQNEFLERCLGLVPIIKERNFIPWKKFGFLAGWTLLEVLVAASLYSASVVGVGVILPFILYELVQNGAFGLDIYTKRKFSQKEFFINKAISYSLIGCGQYLEASKFIKNVLGDGNIAFKYGKNLVTEAWDASSYIFKNRIKEAARFGALNISKIISSQFNNPEQERIQITGYNTIKQHLTDQFMWILIDENNVKIQQSLKKSANAEKACIILQKICEQNWDIQGILEQISNDKELQYLMQQISTKVVQKLLTDLHQTKDQTQLIASINYWFQGSTMQTQIQEIINIGIELLEQFMEQNLFNSTKTLDQFLKNKEFKQDGQQCSCNIFDTLFIDLCKSDNIDFQLESEHLCSQHKRSLTTIYQNYLNEENESLQNRIQQFFSKLVDDFLDQQQLTNDLIVKNIQYLTKNEKLQIVETNIIPNRSSLTSEQQNYFNLINDKINQDKLSSLQLQSLCKLMQVQQQVHFLDKNQKLSYDPKSINVIVLDENTTYQTIINQDGTKKIMTSLELLQLITGINLDELKQNLILTISIQTNLVKLMEIEFMLI